MKIRCEKSQLQEGIHIVQRAVSGRSTLPILNNILLETTAGQVALLAYDLEIGIETWVEASVEVEGGLTVPARIFSEVIGFMPEAEVSLEADERQVLSVSCGKSRYRIHGLAAEEFPRLPLLPTGSASFQIQEATLRRLIRETTFASSVDETRPILTGVLFTQEGDRLTMVATDTHRLAWTWIPLSTEGAAAKEQAAQPMPLSILPARALNECLRLLSSEGSEGGKLCRVTLSDNQAQFGLERAVLQTRLIEGQFPNWEKVVPKEFLRTITIETDELRAALRRAAIVARENANKLNLSISTEGMTITAVSQEVGRAQEDLAVNLEGEPINIAFNARYLLDVLSIIDTEEVVLSLREPLEAGVVRPIAREEYTYVIMPMQPD